MRRFSLALPIAAAALCLTAPAAEAVPLRAQVARCNGIPLEDPVTKAVGNTADLRKMEVQFSYAATSEDTKDDELADTTTVEICTVSLGSGVKCPWSDSGDAAWVVFDQAQNEGEAPDLTRVELIGATTGRERFQVPLDWDDPFNKGIMLFVRVNGSGQVDIAELGNLVTNDGFCPALYPVAGDPGDPFRVYGYLDTEPNPLALFADACTGGNKAAPDLFSANACVTQATADLALAQYLAIDAWQVEKVLGGTPLSPPTWALGSGGDCPGDCPLRIFIQTTPGNSSAGGGKAYLGLTGSKNADPLGKDAAGVIGLVAHEYYHTLQQAFKRTTGAPQPGKHPYVEGGADAAAVKTCLDSYASLPPDLCASVGRLRGGNAGAGVINVYLNIPGINLMQLPYSSSIFWRYVTEQYATPKSASDPAHPAGTSSSYPSDPSFPLGAEERRPDEGVDLMGRFLDKFAQDPARPIMDAIDDALLDHLGRGLEPLLLDFASALVLKDYVWDDPRWHFEWVGNPNADAGQTFFPLNPPTPALGASKAPVPKDLVGVGPDFLRRTRRILDSWEAGPSFAVQKTLAPGDFVASGAPAGLQAHGAAFLSVHPDSTYGPLRVRLTPKAGSSLRFRIFTVDPSGNATLLPGCDQNPSGLSTDTGSCKEKTVSDGNGGTVTLIDEMIPIPANGDIEEVIVVASAGRKSGSFTWSLGTVVPYLAILDPLTSRPAQVGHPAAPDGKRSFLAQFALVDENGLPLPVNETEDLVLSAPGCAAPSCVLSPDGDYTLEAFDDGVLWAVVTLPDSFYPASGSGDFDLKVEAKDLASDTESQALHWSDQPWTMALSLVLDKSGSMDDFGGRKLEAAKIAGTALIEALGEADAVGITTFNEDAQVFFGMLPLSISGVRDAAMNSLAGLTAGGCTSIGDGVLEAQSFLAQYFDNPVGPIFTQAPDVQAMVVLSDGLGNSAYPLYQYYTKQPSPDVFLSDDGEHNHAACDPDPDPSDNQPWFNATLRYPSRVSAGLPVPIVSGVAVGEDSDLGELQNLATVGGGFFTYLVGPADASVQQKMLTSNDFSDAFRSGFNAASGHERVASYRVLAAAPSLMPPLTVEPGATELLVTVTSARDATFVLRLLSPSGQGFNPSQARFHASVFRVEDPEPGVWTWQLTPTALVPPSDGTEAVFVEQAVKAPLQLFAGADVFAAFLPAGPQPGLDGRWVGEEIFVRAVPFIAGEAIRGAGVWAQVTTPDGSLYGLTLYDDGQHEDGEADDGLYGALFTKTGEVGAYSFRVVAAGISPVSGAEFRREQLLAVALRDGDDRDGDRRPDWWEKKYGFSLTHGNHPDEDYDGDGLSDVEEFALHTSPVDADTDGGGQADGSEVALRLDPLTPRDDRLRPVTISAVPGNGRVSVSLPELPPRTTVELGRGTTADGPFTVVFTGEAPPSTVLIDRTENDRLACYRLRRVVDGAASDWSDVVCATPKVDPFPPRVELELVRRTETSAEIEIEAWESPVVSGDEALLDPETEISGLAEMRISTRADFDGTSWVRFQPQVSVPLDGPGAQAIYVEVRDQAGNVSDPASLRLEGR